MFILKISLINLTCNIEFFAVHIRFEITMFYIFDIRSNLGEVKEVEISLKPSNALLSLRESLHLIILYLIGIKMWNHWASIADYISWRYNIDSMELQSLNNGTSKRLFTFVISTNRWFFIIWIINLQESFSLKHT